MISWAIEALIASTILMLVVLALRAPVRREFGANVAYLLWVLPAARLLLPPMPGDWQWSRLFSPMVDRLAATHVVAGVLNGATASPQTLAQAAVRAEITSSAGLADMAIVPPAIVDQGAPVAAVLLGLWALGALCFIGWHLIRYHLFVRSILSDADATMLGGVRMIETDAATGPLAFGIWRKYIAFPRDFRERYDADEQSLAVAHELTHHARGDLIANWAALVVLALHWFNPLAWRAFRAFRADQEMACDARVLAGRSAAFTHAYGRAIVKSAHGRAVSAACHLHTINDLKGRLRMLSTTRKSRQRIMGGALSVCAVTLGGLALTASGTQAAERLRNRVDSTMGGEIARLDRIAVAVAAPVAPLAPAAPQAVPVPPSAVAPVAPTPPAPPVPPVMGSNDTDRREWTDKDGKHHVVVIKTRRGNGKASEAEMLAEGIAVAELGRAERDGSPMVRRRFKMVGPGGKDSQVFVIRKNGPQGDMGDDMKVMTDVPDVRSLRCDDGAPGSDKKVTINEVKDGKRRIIICTNRIERLASAAKIREIDSRDIERKAYRSALDGLRGARARMSAKGGAGQNEAVKAIDEAIAEVEADLAKVN